MNKDIKIGDSFWIMDSNIRVYENNNAVYEKSFYPVTITGETSRSWIVNGNKSYELKAPKKDPFKWLSSEFGFSKQLLNDDMKADMTWKRYHGHKVLHECRRTSISNLRKIAKIIGYEDE